MTLHVVFDLDGTLADTEELVTRAYKMVGVTVPEGAWGKSAQSWLANCVGGTDQAADLHELKNLAYRVLIETEGVPPLAAAHLCRELLSTKGYDVSILTGASFDAAQAVRSSLRLERATILSAGVSLDQKIAILNGFAPTGLYFDDNREACHRVSKETDWQVLYISKLNTTEDIMWGFKEGLARCTR